MDLKTYKLIMSEWRIACRPSRGEALSLVGIRYVEDGGEPSGFGLG